MEELITQSFITDIFGIRHYMSCQKLLKQLQKCNNEADTNTCQELSIKFERLCARSRLTESEIYFS